MHVARLGLVISLSIALAACSGGGTSADKTPNASTAATAQSGEKAEATITGAGATFIYPLLSKWSAEYSQKTGSKINYQSIGSGGGIAQIKAATVDFGSSDKPLASDELAAAGLGQFPSAVGGVVPVVNLPGIAAGQLKLTGPVLADIYLGKVTMWNDAAIAQLNPGVALPATKINVVKRSDGSGTTFNFVNYLSKVSPEWKTKVGEGTSVNWPTGIGGKGNEGVAAYVKQIKGSIGYVELAYAAENGMAHAQMQNAAGQWVQPTIASFQAAAEAADWKNAQDFNLVITNAPGAQAWPIAATNFILMYKQPKDPARSKATLDFFRWAMHEGGSTAESLNYVPLPPDVVSQVEAYWTAQFK
ncbi:phosphate ABC transporter substrate-binding protein PstS [Lysobacter claricitrinus]|uniref:phosphate ABC transporter substrate-binding protein PstS n=1 Tax=Lysobacter claricitrinus TaxID=3367728 RepID=UPI0037DB85B3